MTGWLIVRTGHGPRRFVDEYTQSAWIGVRLSTSYFQVKIVGYENEGEVTVVKIEGNLDTQTSPEAQDELNRLMDEGSQKLLLDFADLAYISSSRLRVLLAVAKRLAPDAGEMRICNLNDVVNEVFEISGFSTILKVFPSNSEALEGF